LKNLCPPPTIFCGKLREKDGRRGEREGGRKGRKEGRKDLESLKADSFMYFFPFLDGVVSFQKKNLRTILNWDNLFNDRGQKTELSCDSL
jgi:hypothetical protein